MEPRIPTDSEVPQLLEFLNKNLRPQADWSISDEYPLVYGSSNRPNLRVLIEDGKVVAHAAIKYHIIKNVLGLFKVAAIGSVVTDSEHRNRGYSQKILSSCLESAARDGADFAILWTDLYDFYRKMGFELAGQELSFVIEQTFETPATDLTFMCSNKVAPEAISKLYLQHTVGTIRSLEEIRRHLTIPNSRVYTAWNKQNQICAYAVEGKGADLNGYIHEWSGSVPHLMALFNHVLKDQKRPLVVLCPSHSKNLADQLSKVGVMNNGYLGMIRILQHQNLFQKIQRHARSLGITDFICEKVGEEYHVGRGQTVYKTSDLKVLTQLLFGPVEKSQNDSTLSPILPIPMWIWGWDSV